MRIIALDVGDRRIGVAFSQSIIANAVETYHCKSHDSDIDHLCRLIEEKEAECLVVGLPKNMDGTEGAQALKAKQLGAEVAEKTGVELVFWDERLSSVSANKILIDSHIRRGERKKYIDRIAAVIILQNYLDYIGGNTPWP